MQQLLLEYGEYLSRARGAAANTTASYLRDIKMFSHYLEAEEKPDIMSVTNEDVCVYLKWMKEERKSTATITRATAGLKSFYSYLCGRGLITRNPVQTVKSDKNERKLPQVLSGKEISYLLEQPDCSDHKGIRDRAMLELLYATGIRVSEMIALNVNDLLMNAHFIKCVNKGKDRIVPLYEGASVAVQSYLTSVREHMLRQREEPALFVNCNGERMTRQGFWKIIKMYKEKARISTDVTPQIIRHTFATHLLENGADLQSIQVMMGHSDISSTQIYANLLKQKIADVYQKAHPMSASKGTAAYQEKK